MNRVVLLNGDEARDENIALVSIAQNTISNIFDKGRNTSKTLSVSSKEDNEVTRLARGVWARPISQLGSDQGHKILIKNDRGLVGGCAVISGP